VLFGDFLKFCKSILGVKQSTCTAAFYSELCRYPLLIKRYVQIVSYWLKIIDSDNIILKTAMYASFELHEDNNQYLASKVHGILNEYGSSDSYVAPVRWRLVGKRG
jgi:hypothetical protein